MADGSMIDWSRARPGQRWHYKGPTAQGFHSVCYPSWEGEWTPMPVDGAGRPVAAAEAAITAASFLRAGLGHMEDRATTYDKPSGERSMGAAVAAMAAVSGVEMTEEQGWLFLALLKAVRTQQGRFRADNYEDGAAYFALAGESAARDRG